MFQVAGIGFLYYCASDSHCPRLPYAIESIIAPENRILSEFYHVQLSFNWLPILSTYTI